MHLEYNLNVLCKFNLGRSAIVLVIILVGCLNDFFPEFSVPYIVDIFVCCGGTVL